MKILVAPDKFKGSLTAEQVCHAVELALINKAGSELDIIKQPLADGGDGTLEVLRSMESWQTHNIETIDPLDRKITARYLSHQDEVFIELAEASGITKLSTSELDVMNTTTIGTGFILNHVLGQGFKKIILGLGGSCTTDMGLGIAYAIDYKFLDHMGSEVIPCGGTLSQIMKIVAPATKPDFDLTILCDIDNPLYGPKGAAYIFGPQKGANPTQVIELDQGLRHISKIMTTQLGRDISTLRGGGSAGGIAAGLTALFPNAKLCSGFDYLGEKLDLPSKVKSADLVISGEGKLDHTSLNGKLIGKLSELCIQHEVPLDIVCGVSSLMKKELIQHHIRHVYQVIDMAQDPKDAMENAKQYIESITFKS